MDPQRLTTSVIFTSTMLIFTIGMVLVIDIACLCSAHEYCLNSNLSSQKLFCLGVDKQVLDFGAGYGCLSEPSCSIIISGRKLYKNSTWFKVYLPVQKDAVRVDLWFMITKREVSFAKNSEQTKKLGVRDTMIAKGEGWNNGTLNVFSYRMTNSQKTLTSSSFFSFAPDRKSSKMVEAVGARNYTVFSWRASEYLTEGDETFNYHKTPVRVTLRTLTRSLIDQKVTVIQTDRHMIFEDPSQQQPEGQIENTVKVREEL